MICHLFYRRLLGLDISLSLISIVIFVCIGIFLSGLILYTKSKLVSSASCKIRINRDDSLIKESEGGSTLLNVLLSNEVAVPSPCGGKATCKQCKVQVIEGGGPVIETDKATFSPKELKDGWRLSCQCKVKNDLEILLPENMLTLKEYTGKVLSNKNVATFIKELVVELDEEVPYQSGDYFQFHVPPFKTNTSDWKKTIEEKYFTDWEKFHFFDQEINYLDLDEDVIRAYSMASYPKEGKIFKFNIRIATPPCFDGEVSKKIPWGICSSYIFSLKEGDSVHLSGPFGESHMIDDEREIYFLIGGAGSSFGRSHILDLFLSKNTTRKVELWYGARSLKENIYQEEYEKLSREKENFSYHLVLSEPSEEDLQTGWDKSDPIKTNFVVNAFEDGALKNHPAPEDALYYVCGPPLHNSSIMTLLDNYGVERKNIVLDDFGS